MAYSVEGSSDGCYEGTSVLINKPDIRDERELAEAEGVITAAKIAILLSEPYDGEFGSAHYCDIHRFIMGDLYDWAGKLRTVDLSKKGTSFHSAKGLEKDMGLLFGYLNEYDCFVGMKHKSFAEHIAEFYHDLNMLHPFREGNGRAQRVLITQLIEHAGYGIDLSACDKDMLMIATIHAAHGVMDYLTEFFIKNIKL